MSTRSSVVPAVLVAALAIGSLAACATPQGSSDTATPTATSSAQSEPLPADFPKDDVPLIPGTIAVAAGDEANGWSVTVDPATKSGFADARAALAAKGFTQSAGTSKNRALFTSDAYTVYVSTPGISVTYTITANQ